LLKRKNETAETKQTFQVI